MEECACKALMVRGPPWQKHGLDPQHAQISTRSNGRRTRTADGFEPSSPDAMAAMDWRITAPSLTSLLTCFSISGRYQKEMGTTGRSRVCALLRGWVDRVVSPGSGSYVLGGPEAAVPIFHGNVMLDILMSDQAAEGVPLRSRTLLSMQVCLCIGNLFLPSCSSKLQGHVIWRSAH